MRKPKDRGNNPSAYETQVEYTKYLFLRSKAARRNNVKRHMAVVFSLIGMLSLLGILGYAIAMRFLSEGGWSWSDPALWSLSISLSDPAWFIPFVSTLGIGVLLIIIDSSLYFTSFGRIAGINPRSKSAEGLLILSLAAYLGFMALTTQAEYRWFFLIPVYAGAAFSFLGTIIEISISEYGYEKR